MLYSIGSIYLFMNIKISLANIYKIFNITQTNVKLFIFHSIKIKIFKPFHLKALLTK